MPQTNLYSTRTITSPKRQSHRWRYMMMPLLCLSTFLTVPDAANANPKDGQVAAGTATITQTAPDRVDINQQSQKAVINWGSFNIGTNETTNFNQPGASAITLNRVTGVDPSAILGNLTANGQVWLVNTNGIVFGKTARVDVAGLLATTLDIKNSDFMAGHYKFTSNGTTGAMVLNEGQITINQAGLAALVAPGVENSGYIQANLGHVQLSSASGFTIDLYGDGKFNFLLDDKVTEAITSPDGSNPTAAVSNSGQLIADGGRVLLTANAAKSVVDRAINMDGYIRATNVNLANGEIILNGGSEGTVEVSGTLDASAPVGGDGGFIETSGSYVKVDDTAHVTTFATDGKMGTWLIDPNDFTIAASGGNISGTALSANLASNSVTISTATQGTAGGNGDIFVNDAVSWSADTTFALAAERTIEVNANITATGDGAGLTLGYGSGQGYTLDAGKKITLSGAAPTLKIGVTGSESSYIVINSLGVAGDTSTTTLQGMRNNLSGLYALGSDIDATATSGWNGGAGFEPVAKTFAFTGSFDGLGHIITELTINRPSTNNVGLFGGILGLGTARNVGLEGSSVIGNGAVGSLVGSIGSIGMDSTIDNCYSTGSVSGNFYVGGLVGHSRATISNSYSTGSVTGNTYVGGLVGRNDDDAIDNSYSTGSVTGNTYVGGLVGVNDNGPISNSYSTGAVNGYDQVGGLVGATGDNISNSYSTGVVNGNDHVGGLVGHATNSTISNSYSTGTVTGNNSVGGLVGWNTSTISSNYSTSAVIGIYNVGGLVGTNVGTISSSYSTGTVSDILRTTSFSIGGLVGYNNNGGTITNSYSTGIVSCSFNPFSVGGLVGYNNTGGTITNSYSTGTVSGSTNFSGLVGENFGTISNSYWDTESSGRLTSAGGTGLTTAELTSGLPTGFDSTIWAIRLDVNNGYPYLQWQTVSAPAPTPATPAPTTTAHIVPTTTAEKTSVDQSDSIDLTFTATAPFDPTMFELTSKINKRKKILPGEPEYLYEASTWSGAISATWMEMTGSLTGSKELRVKYDEFYFAALEYRKMAQLQLHYADTALKNNNTALAQHHLSEYDRYLKLFNLSNSAAIDTYMGNSDASTEFAKGINKGSKMAVKFGAKFVAPGASVVLNRVFTATDFAVNWSEGGLSFAAKETAKEVIVDVILNEIPFDELGGKTISSFVGSNVTKGVGSSGLYNVLDTTLKKPEFQKALMKVVADGSAFTANEISKSIMKANLDQLTIPQNSAYGVQPVLFVP